MGAAFVLLYRRGINPFQTWLGGILILNLLFTFSIPNISKGGHIGGLVGGCVAALLIAASEQRRLRVAGLVGCLALAGVCAGFAIAVAEPEAF
jgi:membrane associated rhomboid family serine protease